MTYEFTIIASIISVHYLKVNLMRGESTNLWPEMMELKRPVSQLGLGYSYKLSSHIEYYMCIYSTQLIKLQS